MPIIPAVAKTQGYVFNNAFNGTGIKKAELPDTAWESYSCNRMFSNCSKLKEVRVHFTSWHEIATAEWLNNVSPTGTFYKPSALPEEYGVSRIPTGWTVVNID